ncbi:MAG: penicillin-binding protein 2 [Deltaproteobacteria bacterium]|nr:penicillin-binding protein 2 [Deltaproteobacteria bacterium]
MTAVFFVLLFRVWQLQILHGQKWYAFSEENRIKLKTIPAVRGRIFDRNHKMIAESRPSYDLIMVPNKAGKNIDQALLAVSKLIGWNYEEAKKNYTKYKHPNSNRGFSLKKNLSRNEVAIIKANQPRIDGFDVQFIPTRTYIYPGSANHLLGRMGEIDADAYKNLNKEDRQRYGMGMFWGVSGIEKKYELELRGHDGVRPVLEDVWGREQELSSTNDLLSVFKGKKSIAGSDVYLTIDMDLQLLASELLEGKKGSIVALDPRSGEILAMESKPSYISEYFVRGVDAEYWKSLIDNADKPLFDRSVQAIYPPASTFKVVSAFASLMEKITTPEETVFCPGYYRLGREVKRCWKRSGHGYMNLSDAIKHSCDVYFYEMSKRLGIENLAKYARAFGLGSKTDIDFARESSGLVPDQAWKQKTYGQPWVGGETLSVGIGQGAILTTPLQMAVVYATLINGGRVLQPQVLKGISSPDEIIEKGFQRKEKAVIEYPDEVMQPILDGMQRVVQEVGGTAYWYANSRIVPVAGKTGTAQVVSLKSDKDIKDHAWFVGYAPSEDPEIVVAVIVENGEHGSSGASPLARHIIEKYFAKENI